MASLEQGSPTAKALGERARAVLVFPNIVKAGFLVGAQGGDGTSLKKGRLGGYYNTTAVSYSLQAGVQTYGYALYFMSDGVLSSLREQRRLGDRGRSERRGRRQGDGQGPKPA